MIDKGAISISSDGKKIFLNGKTLINPFAIGTNGATLTISPSRKNFSSVQVGNDAEEVVSIRNNLTTDLPLGGATLGGTGAAAFAIAVDGCSNTTLQAGTSCTIKISFTPAAYQAYTANVNIPYGTTSANLTLSGTGIATGSAYATYTLWMTRGGAPTSSLLGSSNGDNDFASTFELDYVKDNAADTIISHALYPVEFYTQKTSAQSGFITARTGVSDPGASDTRQPLILIHGWQGDSGVDRDPKWLLEDEQLGETYWNNFIQYFNKTPEFNQRYRLYVYHYPTYKHVSFNARLLSQLLPRVAYIKNWLATGKQVSILAHSMGGLVSRSLIEEHDGVIIKQPDGSSTQVTGLNMLERLITTATPHHGSPSSVYWWLENVNFVTSYAEFIKDLLSPGAQDLFWDNYDGVFDWVLANAYSLPKTGDDLNRIDFANSGRRTENSAFDGYYRTKLKLLDNRANDVYSASLSIKIENQDNQATVYRYSNPWLSWLNARFRQNKSFYSGKYMFYGGYNDGNNLSPDNRINDSYKDIASDDPLYVMGYINDWAVPLTSSFLDFSKENTGALNSFNPTLFSDSGGKSALFPSWLTDHSKVIHTDKVNDVPVRVFKDYNHDRMLNGAYYSNPADLLDAAQPSGFVFNEFAQPYLMQANVTCPQCNNFIIYQGKQLPNPELGPDAKLIYEPLFNLVKADLLSPVNAHSITLSQGWNLISLPVQPSQTAVGSLLGALGYRNLWGYTGGAWRMYDPANPIFSDLSEMAAGNGYWIYATGPATLQVQGSAADKSVSLASGWNLVGFSATAAQDVGQATSAIGPNLDKVWGFRNGAWQLYDPANPIFSDLATLEPGRGYWIKMKQSGTWTLP
ncbi:MAG: choice-of-anchor D domain-containing protein [Deltaproteobacteria bacterium]|nr:choice-of-anchor D domain-containing protein [Deltaproteobacteria bacterium]